MSNWIWDQNELGDHIVKVDDKVAHVVDKKLKELRRPFKRRAALIRFKNINWLVFITAVFEGIMAGSIVAILWVLFTIY